MPIRRQTSLGRRGVPLSERLQGPTDGPRAEVLAIRSVGHTDGHLRSFNLVLACRAPDLVGRLGKAEQARSSDRVARQHPSGGVDGQRATEFGGAVLHELPSPALVGKTEGL